MLRIFTVIRMLSIALLTCAALPHTLSSSTDQQYESDLLRLGLALSSRHSKAFPQLFSGQFFKPGNKKKGKERNRTKRAFWGLDKFFTDAKKTKIILVAYLIELGMFLKKMMNR